MEKVAVEKMFSKLNRVAIGLGFDNVWFDKYGTFSAEYTESRIEFRIKSFQERDEEMDLGEEISWSSAGMPRPSREEVKKFRTMINAALALQHYFNNLMKEDLEGE